MNARMIVRGAVLCTLLAGVWPASGLGFAVGATASVGQGFGYGSYFDAKAALLREYGASAMGTDGTARPYFFVVWNAGAFAEIEFLDWLSLRLEACYSSLGAAYLASGATPFDVYAASYASITLPVLACARFPLGSGRLTALAGPILGFAASGITIEDRYASATTSATFPFSAPTSVQIGLSVGLGYEIAFGPGFVGLELRTDVMLTSATANTGPVGGEIMPVPVSLAASYKLRLGGAGE